ncbi:MAG: hypothetical protein JXN59_17665 [Anaerolineae bacterium]|nr:hypothetical protein [Anaerolineae bacterium]
MRSLARLLLAVGVTILSGCAIFIMISATPTYIHAQGAAATPHPDGDVATLAEVARAYALWVQSGHAETYDNGMGADTTCARCKSPMNWDPTHPAAEAALDCASCKRVPGEERPILDGGEPVAEADWQHVGCPVCHEPVGDSYRVTPAFWNQALGAYEPVESVDELCAHCHEGQHGFEVVEEMAADRAHSGFECLECHDPHGDQISCEDCHDPFEGEGAEVHADHPEVHCSACHDRGGLHLWRERDEDSDFYGEVITIRFAHTLTAWPSHNLQTEVACGTCHHAKDETRPPLAESVGCDNAACHPQGAVMSWCPYFTDSLQEAR